MTSINIVSSQLQTKKWRKDQSWYKNGKHNECELYQIGLIKEITNQKFNKTLERLNMVSLNIEKIYNPMKYENGYEWSETFDGYIDHDNIKHYFNLKFICDKGGAQTRALQLVYMFVNFQLKYLVKNNKKDIYFINILDGDTSYLNINKFKYLLNKPEFNDIKQYVFVGDMSLFNKYWKK
jgi:hypothetical protein